jgi:hypothetical protein
MPCLSQINKNMQEGLGGGILPPSGGSGGRNPQIRVLATPENSDRRTFILNLVERVGVEGFWEHLVPILPESIAPPSVEPIRQLFFARRREFQS